MWAQQGGHALIRTNLFSHCSVPTLPNGQINTVPPFAAFLGGGEGSR